MKRLTLFFATFILTVSAGSMTGNDSAGARFNMDKDFLLVQYDCKTDVDDLHTIAAFRSLISDPAFSNLHYYAVAGAYGIQDGLYVPPNNLFRQAFGNNWSNAHENAEKAVKEVIKKVKATIKNYGDVWIAEAGQSDFTAKLVSELQNAFPELNTQGRIHVIQHSDWNEKSTSPESLAYVKKNCDYIKIPDGNTVSNGSPGFRDEDYTDWKQDISNEKLASIWQLASDISTKYNGKDGRYNNSAIANGGLDFSDLSEVCWIFGLEDIKDARQFFKLYVK
ncbi:hypothetical protein ACE01N_03010 [Saccharicrinis sp. FJH2]|uniref:hypothetical protein n=1 Tax=Saccharicrinis sp. FJH65 TaxID=3344659 RepID=UPI0035F3D17E